MTDRPGHTGTSPLVNAGGRLLEGGAVGDPFGLGDLLARRILEDQTADAPRQTRTSNPVEATAERLMLAVLSSNGLTVDFNSEKVVVAFETVASMLAMDLGTDAIVSFLNQEFAAEFAAGRFLDLEDASSLSTTDGAPRGGGITEAQLLQQFETGANALDQGFSVSIGPDGAVVKSPSGKVVQSFSFGEDGLFHPILSEETGGGAGSGAQAARDARGIFEDTRDFAEDVFRDRRNFGEDTRRFDLGFDEDITQNRLQEGRLNRADVGQLGVQLGELNLRMQEFVAQILREPADFLARAFTQRGGTSPFPEITQADLINQLRTEFQRIRDFTAEQLGLNSAQIAQLPSPASNTFEEVATALGPEAQLITKSVTTREAVEGEAATGGGGGGGVLAPPPPLDDSEFDLGFVGNELGRPAPSFVEPTLDFDELGEQGLTEEQVPRKGGFLGGFLNTNPQAPSNFLREPEPTRISGLVDEEFEFAHGTPEENKPGKKGGADNELSLVGEAGPELMINHGDGSFDIISNDDLMSLMKNNKKRKKDSEKVQSFVEGTLEGLTPDDLGRLSLFDTVDVRQTSPGELESNALMATPPGPSAVLSGTKIPDLDVAGGSGFKLFSPQEFAALTPDEQVALRTRLASKNRSLSDFLFAQQRAFVGSPRRRPRAVFDVTR